MEKNKYYVVLKGSISGIFLEFDEFKKAIKDFDDVEFEIFYDAYEAINYLRASKYKSIDHIHVEEKEYETISEEGYVSISEENIGTKEVNNSNMSEENMEKTRTEDVNLSRHKDEIKTKKISLSDNDKNLYIDKNDAEYGTYEAYVDGSFDSNSKTYGSGVVILKNSKIIKKISSKGKNEEYISMRNVAGEIEGAMIAMKYCLENNIGEIKIYYDYLGIEKWCLGEWKANKNGTKEYKKFYDKVSKKIKISFEKVRAHSGNKYNEMADLLAKKAVE